MTINHTGADYHPGNPISCSSSSGMDQNTGAMAIQILDDRPEPV
jgi:hypothetical protein